MAFFYVQFTRDLAVIIDYTIVGPAGSAGL
jgi:hypothetical protein